MTATGDTATSKLELIMGRDGLARLADSTVMVLGVGGDGLEESDAVGVLPRGVGVGEVLADVARGDRAEQGVHEGVDGDVRVGVAEKAAFVGNDDAAEDEPAVLHKPMRVEADSSPGHVASP